MGSFAFIGEGISAWAWVGVAIICIGVVTLGLSRSALRHGDETQRRKALGFALANAAIIALYTVIDGLGVRASGDALAYVAALFVFDGIPYLLLVLWRRPGQRRAALPLHGGPLEDRIDRHRGLARQLRHRAVGDDARAGGRRRGAARDLGAVRGADRHAVPARGLRLAARRRHRRHRRRRDALRGWPDGPAQRTQST